MAEYNVRINVKNSTGYDQLYPESKSDIINFDKTGSNLSSTDVENAIKEVNTKSNTNKTSIGTLTSLTTDSKTNLVGAINEVDSHANTAQSTANTNKTNIGTLSSLKTSIKTSIVNAINSLYDSVVHKTSVIDNLDDIIANQSNGMVAGAKAVAELNGNMFYKPGDDVTLNSLVAFGILTTSKTQMMLTIPVAKSLENIQTAQLVGASGLIRQNGKYLINSDGTAFNFTQSRAALMVLKNSNTIRLTYTFSGALDAINNDLLSVQFYGGKIELS